MSTIDEREWKEEKIIGTKLKFPTRIYDVPKAVSYWNCQSRKGVNEKKLKILQQGQRWWQVSLGGKPKLFADNVELVPTTEEKLQCTSFGEFLGDESCK